MIDEELIFLSIQKAVYSDEGKRKAEKFLAEMGEYKSEALGHVLMLDEFNCREAKGRSLSMIIYDINGRRVASSPEGAPTGVTLFLTACTNGLPIKSANRD